MSNILLYICTTICRWTSRLLPCPSYWKQCSNKCWATCVSLKTVVRCHEVGGSALTICMLSGPRASSILVKGSANLLSFHTTFFWGFYLVPSSGTYSSAISFYLAFCVCIFHSTSFRIVVLLASAPRPLVNEAV